MNPSAKTEQKTSYKNFIYDQITPIEELNCTLIELTHEPTGAKVIHIANEDPENVFCLGLKTWPNSSDGAPHILEHTVLCGSKKFPVKDPFFGMTRRSLNTFMNAFTGADFTCYPAASQIKQDFYNLLEVYCDAVFFPQLKELSFLQEGHRLEFAKPNDPSTPLTYQGIVYNEMKGAMSSPDSRLWKAISKNLLPDLTYAVNSGGDPADIPSLTYQGLKDFHATYYHPSRCLFYFYGNLPLEPHLDFIETHVLSQVEKVEPLGSLPLQKRFTAPRQAEERFPTQDKTLGMAAFCWLTTTPTNVEHALALSLLDSILTDHDASPLKRALLESGKCGTADGHLDIEMSEIPYVILCKGCKQQDIEALQNIILTTLDQLYQSGIDPEIARSALHQLEFERLEIGGGGYPFGLGLFFRAGLLKQHGGEPKTGLCVYSTFETLQEKIRDPSYLGGLIKTYLLDNPHFVTLKMVPDKQLESEEAAIERTKLDQIRASMSEKEIEEVIANAARLKTFQLQNESASLDCLPKLSIEDVPEKTPDFKLDTHQVGGLTVYHHDVFTNHILYAALVFDLPNLSADELPYAQLYTSILTELGAGDRTFIENLSLMQAHLGDVSTSISLHAQADSADTLRPSVILRGKALWRNRKQLFEMLHAFATSARTDEAARIKELILQIHTHLTQRLVQSSMGYATLQSTAHTSKIGRINSHWQGLAYYQFISKLAHDLDAHLPHILNELSAIAKKLFTCSIPDLVMSCDEESFAELAKEKFYGISDGLQSGYEPFHFNLNPSTPQSGGYPISAPVAFTSMGFKTIDSTDPRAPSISLASELFDNKVLHPKIREQGGAYGSGSSYNTITGSFYFYGYRDPNLASTVEAFKAAAKSISQGEFTEEDLVEAKLGLIQEFDSPLYPGSRALAAYVWKRDNKTVEWRQAFRDAVLKGTKADVCSAVKECLLPALNDGCLVTFAGQELIENENKKLAKPLAIFSI